VTAVLEAARVVEELECAAEEEEEEEEEEQERVWGREAAAAATTAAAATAGAKNLVVLSGGGKTEKTMAKEEEEEGGLESGMGMCMRRTVSKRKRRARIGWLGVLRELEMHTRLRWRWGRK
jgi:hypothetical protein